MIAATLPGRGATMHAKWFTWLAAFVISLAAEVPHPVQVAVWCFFIAFMADNITGVWAAGKNRKLRSEMAREKMRLKILSYLGIMAGFSIIAIAVSAWPVVTVGLAWITANEVQSILENVMKLQCAGGNLGLLRGPLKILAAWFDVQMPGETMTVAATTTLIPADSSQPVIQTQTVDRVHGRER